MGIQLVNLSDTELEAFLEEFIQQEITSSCEMEATSNAVGAGRPGRAAMARASAGKDRTGAEYTGGAGSSGSPGSE